MSKLSKQSGRLLALSTAVSLLTLTTVSGLGFHAVEAAETPVNTQIGADQLPSPEAEGAFWYNGVINVADHANYQVKDLTHYQKSRVVMDRTLAPRAFFIPTLTAEDALAHTLDWRGSSGWQSLNGDWDFKLVAKPAEVIPEFIQPDFQPAADAGWRKLAVPGSWPLQDNGIGDEPAYANHTYPWAQRGNGQPNIEGGSVNYGNAGNATVPTSYNPVAHYRTHFVVPAAQQGKRAILDFHGVESGFYVYVNGRYVGYSEDSFTLHEFDVTDYLNPSGENTLAVLVYRWSDGNLFENQDFIDLAGIFRDVGLIYRSPQASLEDYHLDLTVEADQATVQIAAQRSGRSIGALTATLYDPQGQVVSTQTLAADQNEMTLQVQNPQKWSVDQPTLYKLLLEQKNAAGEITEVTAQDLGLREVKQFALEGGKHTYALNGVPIRFKGVNRHELDAERGRAIRLETIHRDLQLMKQNNVNAIRTSHYPNGVDLYLLANHYGIMILDEANLETHAAGASIPGTVEEFRFPALHRAMNMYERDKNFTSVVAWSNGNEAVYSWPTKRDHNYSIQLMHDYIKARDPKRPQVFERDNAESIADVRSTMYNGVSGDVGWLASADPRPYLQVEYAHSMGNSLGYYKEYWDTWRQYPNSMGGFIWDWVDQSPLWPIPSGEHLTLKPQIPQTAQWQQSGELTDQGLKGRLIARDAALADFHGSDQQFTLFAEVTLNQLVQHNSLINHGDQQYLFKATTEGTLEFATFSNGWHAVKTQDKLTVNQRHQVGVSYDKGQVAIYIDGQKVKTEQLPNEISPQAQNLGIGADAQLGRPLHGVLHRVAIYQRAVDLSQVTPAQSDEGLVVYQAFEGEGVHREQPLYTGRKYGSDGNLYYAYGGDWAKDKINNDNNFLDNGLISAHREPHGQVPQMKHVQQDILFKAYDPATGQLTLENEFDRLNLAAFDLSYQVLKDGQPLGEPKPFAAQIPPRSEGTAELPSAETLLGKAPQEETSQLTLQVQAQLKADTLWAQKGYTVAWQQFPLNEANRQTYLKKLNELTAHNQVTETDEAVTIHHDGLEVKINKQTGRLVSYTVNGEAYLDDQSYMEAHFWRPPVDNDRQNGFLNRVAPWRKSTENRPEVQVSVEETNPQLTKVSVHSRLANGSTLDEEIWVYSDGHLHYFQDLQAAQTNEIPAIGTLWTLPQRYNQLTYFGRGPKPSYRDRWEGYPLGVYQEKIDETNLGEYVKPQENGNHMEIFWAKLTDAQDHGLIVKSASIPLQVQAQIYDPYDITDRGHPYELTATDRIFWRVNSHVAGVGGQNSWGAQPEAYAKIPSGKRYRYDYEIEPVKPELRPEKFYRTVYREAGLIQAVRLDGKPLAGFNESQKTYSDLAGSDLKLYLFDPTHQVQYTLEGQTLTAVIQNAQGETLDTYTFTFSEHRAINPDEVDEVEAEAERVNENTPPENAIDGDPSTFWHTPWNGTQLPVDFVITLKEPATLTGLNYLPRANGRNGNFQEIEVFYQAEGDETWHSIQTATWSGDDQPKQLEFAEPIEAKRVKIRVKRGVNGYASAAEISLQVENAISYQTVTLEQADAAERFRIEHAAILAKTPETLSRADEAALKAALAAYQALGVLDQSELRPEWERLDALQKALEALKEKTPDEQPTPQPEAPDFRPIAPESGEIEGVVVEERPASTIPLRDAQDPNKDYVPNTAADGRV